MAEKLSGERTDMSVELHFNGGNMNRRRPGPFGAAWALLPKDQQPLVLDGSTPASDAIERLVDNGFSQLPVADKTGRIIGVFSWKSFGKRVADIYATTSRRSCPCVSRRSINRKTQRQHGEETLERFQVPEQFAAQHSVRIVRRVA